MNVERLVRSFEGGGGWVFQGVEGRRGGGRYRWPGLARAINGGRGLSRCGIKRFTTGPQISTDAMDECEGGSRHPPPFHPRSTIWVRLPNCASLPLFARPNHPRRSPATLSRVRPELSVVVFASDSNSGRSRERLKSSENLELDDFAGIGAKIKCYRTQVDISRYTYTPGGCLMRSPLYYTRVK